MVAHCLALSTKNPSAKKSNQLTNNAPARTRDLSTSLLAYITNHLASARRQGIRLNTLTIVTDDLSVRQLRRLSSAGNRKNAGKVNTGIRVFSTAIGAWEIRVGGSLKIHLVHSQLRRVAARSKADLAIMLERVSKAIIAPGKKDNAGGTSGKILTEWYLLKAYLGTQLWLHGQSAPKGEKGKERAWYEYDIAALSFVEPYIDACPQAKAAAQLGRRVGASMGVVGLEDEEAELAWVNEVLLQVVSPFSGGSVVR